MKKILQCTLWAIGFLLLHFQGLAQEAPITGRVVAASDNSPLPGVSVTIKGTTSGTVTDADGKFAMTARSSDVLMFSFIGMESKEVTVGSSQTFSITLDDAITTLGEVVIAEFGIKRASRAMGSEVQTVSGKEVAESGRDNFAAALMGRVSGLTVVSSGGAPGSSSSIQLRSITSISGNNQPLFVVDGVPMNNSTYDPINNAGPTSTVNSVRDTDYSSRGNDFNMEDIESMTILKGPAAAALYGSNASNGAIIITTKKGSGKGGKVSYSNQFRWDNAYGYPEFQTKYGNGSYGTTNHFNTSQFGSRYPEGTKLYDNIDAVMQTGVTSKHNFSVEGGTEKASLRASASYLDQTGVIKTTDYSRFNLSLAGKAEVNKWLSFEAFMQYTSTTNTKAPRGALGTLGRAMLWPQVDNMANYLDADGEHMRMPDLYTDTDLLNPLFALHNNKLYDESDRILSTATVALTPFENAFVRAQLGWDVGVSTYEISTHPYFFNNNAGRGAYNITKTNFSDPTVNILAGYNKQLFEDKFSVSAQVGYHQLQNGVGSVSSYGSDFLVPGFQSINNTNSTSQTSTKITTKRRIQAVSGQVELGYNNMAFITLRGRNDWSSTLPKANNAYFYPAIEGSLVISDISFMQDLKSTIDYLKLRGSIAQVGRDAGPNEIDPQLIPTALTGGGYRYNNTGPNKDLMPEMTTSKEIGIETRFLNDRINADFTHFWTNCSDQIVKEFRLSYATGFILNTLNVGSFETWGWEGHIDGDIIRSASGLTWNVGVNASRTNSEVVSLPANVTEYYNAYTWNTGNIRNGIAVGHPVTTISGNAYARNEAGDILISPTSGLPLVNTNWTIIGNREPKVRFGITSAVTYKAISLSAMFAGRFGATVVNGTKRLMMQRGVSWESVELRESGPVIFNGVLKDGNEESETPTRNNISVNYGTQGSGIFSGGDEDWMEKVNYLRLQEIRLGYRLPSAWLKRISVSSANIYVTGNDLFTWTNYSGIDAVGNTMSGAAGGTGGEGIDVWGLPNPRGISVGLGVTF